MSLRQYGRLYDSIKISIKQRDKEENLSICICIVREPMFVSSKQIFLEMLELNTS